MGNIEFNYIQLIILFGAAQGFAFSSVIFLTKKYRISPMLYVGITVFFLSFTNLVHMLFDVNSTSVLIRLLSELYIPWQWLVAPFLYCYINAYYGNAKLSKLELSVLFIPFFIVLALHGIQYLNKSIFSPDLVITAYYKRGLFLYTNIVSFIHTPGVIYMIYKMVNTYEIKHKNNAEKEKIKWVKRILHAGFAICTLAALSIAIILIYNPESSFVAYPFFISISLWIYWVGYASLNKSMLLQESLTQNSTNTKVPKTTTQKTGYSTYTKIDKSIKAEKLFLENDLSLNTVSKKYEISSGYLSQLINQHSNTNFNDYINKLRIDEAKLMLLDSSYENYTIDAIALECGFRSKSNFYTIFKKITQQTPNQYKNSQLINSESSTS